jgi:hypothetical protein
MGINRTEMVTCDACGREPGPPTNEQREACRGTMLHPIDSSDRYGWISLTPRHLCIEALGHNRIDSLEHIVLCDGCWPKILAPVLIKRGT